MKKILISDVSFVLLFPKDPEYTGSLNGLYREHKEEANFNFFGYFKVNTELLDIYTKYASNDARYIFTSDAIQDDPALQEYWQPVFTEIHSAKKMSVEKNDPKAYEVLLQTIHASSEDVLYIDDKQENVDAAQQMGISTILYRSNEEVAEQLKKQMT